MSSIPPTGVGFHPPMWEEWLGTAVPFAVALLLLLVLLRRCLPRQRSPLPRIRVAPLATRLATVAPYLPFPVAVVGALWTALALAEKIPKWTPLWMILPAMPGAIIASLNDSWVEHNYMTPTKLVVGAVTNFAVWWFATRAIVRVAVRKR
jgi:hypothetical protein